MAALEEEEKNRSIVRMGGPHFQFQVKTAKTQKRQATPHQNIPLTYYPSVELEGIAQTWRAEMAKRELVLKNEVMQVQIENAVIQKENVVLRRDNKERVGVVIIFF